MQARVLQCLHDSLSTQQLSPTLEEISQELGLHRVTVFGHVRELERKGLVEKEPHRARSLQLTDQAKAWFDSGTAGQIPVRGRIAAGAPIEAIEDEESLDLNDWWRGDRPVFGLRVQGHSMVDDGIHDGDVVLVESRSDPRDGETVVAILADEAATLKRFYREPAGIRLEPANANMEPLHVTECEVRGIVVGVVRRLR